MALRPKRAAVIGLDSAMPHFFLKYMADGDMPNMKALMERGWWADNCIPALPTITPPNWATIANGAHSGTHGQPCFRVPVPGTDPDNAHVLQQLDSTKLKCEFIWDAADKAGLRCLVLNYPTAWPSHMKNGIVIGGRGLGPCENRNGQPDADALYGVGKDFIITTRIMGPYCAKGGFKKAEGWQNCPDLGKNPLEMEVRVPFYDPDLDPAPHTWWLLVRQLDDDGYTLATLSPSKDFAEAFCTLRTGEWSGNVFTPIKLKSGKSVDVAFGCKLLYLHEEAEDVRFLVGAMSPLDESWSTRPDLFKEIYSGGAMSHWGNGFMMYSVKMIDVETLHEMIEHERQWLINAARAMVRLGHWDLFYMHCHHIDWTYHMVFPQMMSKDERTRQKAWEDHRRILMGEDAMVGELLKILDDGDTAVVVVSDHGAGPDGDYFDPMAALTKSGLAFRQESRALGEDENALQRLLSGQFGTVTYGADIDYSRTKATPRLKNTIVINQKGKYPHGIVEPEDYKKVQKEIIDCLLDWRDPKTGERPIVLALSREDAMSLNIYGDDDIGDVIYALYPEYSSQHGPILGTATWGELSNLRSLLVFAGPGIVKNTRYQRPCQLEDIVPTLCYLCGFPIPNGVDGAVIYNVMKNPNAWRDEVERLKGTIESMELTLAKDGYNPYGKETCL